jgi:hypothetical protein
VAATDLEEVTKDSVRKGIQQQRPFKKVKRLTNPASVMISNHTPGCKKLFEEFEVNRHAVVGKKRPNVYCDLTPWMEGERFDINDFTKKDAGGDDMVSGAFAWAKS